MSAGMGPNDCSFLSSLIITTSSLITRNTTLSTGVGPNPYYFVSFFDDFCRFLQIFDSFMIKKHKMTQEPPKSRQEPPKRRPRAAQKSPRAAQELPQATQAAQKQPKSHPRAVPSRPKGAQIQQKPCKNQCETRVVENAFRIVFCISFGT